MSSEKQNTELKERLLQHYSRREPRAFTQYDGYTVIADHLDGDVLVPDQDGDNVGSRQTWELMTGLPRVRVLRTEGTDKADVLRLLKKIMTVIEHGSYR